MLFAICTQVSAQVCAPPALLLTAIPPGGIVNDFYPGSGTPNLNSGVSSFTLGTRDTRGYTTTLVVGDLLMVMQMQDGTIDSSNNSNYGDGTGVGYGSTGVGSAGLFEFVRVTAVAGLNVTVTPPLNNSYVNADATAATAQKRYQVVRALQFSSVTAINVITPPWNGFTGGVVAMDVRDTLTLGSSTIDGVANRSIFVAGKGFRGGQTLGNGTDGTNIAGDYATSSVSQYHASKGEGIIGTPRFVAIKSGAWSFKNTNPITITTLVGSTTTGGFEGYPGGSYARGAPGNAGGGGVDSDQNGGNSNNSGGGGGGNYGPGGIGGRPWNSPLLDLGGRGGAGYAGTLQFNRVFMGGGGGAGGSNNSTFDAATYTNNGISCGLGAGICSSGAAGGGVVVIRARQITGTGVIDARGAHGFNVNNDAGGGGGAGGSVILQTPNGGSANVDVSGGDGGNAYANDNVWPGGRHGPGGAGGGGFVAFAPNTMAVAVTFAGGAPGETEFNAPIAGRPVPEYYGSSGFNGGITTFQVPNVPGVPQAALCDPSLSLRKSNGVTSLTSPGSSTYTLTITNTGNSASSGTITVADRLPPGLTVVPGPLVTGGPDAASFSCTASTNTNIICISNIVVQPNGGTRAFAIGTSVNGANGLSVVNRALISGGGDPTKTTTATVTLADLCTANDTPGGCAVDTDTILAPNLVLTKTDGVTTILRGATTTYNLTVSNAGGSVTVGTITVADLLPAGLTFNGTSPFTVNNFTCTVSGQGITCDRNLALAASASATITFSAVVTGTVSTVINLAKVGGGGDPSPGKSTRPTTVTAALCPSPVSPADTSSDPDTGCAADADAVRYVSLDLTKDDGTIGVLQLGQTNYSFVVRNIGTAATAGQINFGDVLPGSIMTFVATGTFTPTGTNGADWSCTRSTASTTFCVSSTSIPAGGSSSFILAANIGNTPDGNQLLNRARVGGGGDVTAGSVNSPTVANIQACVGDGSPQGCAIDLDTVIGQTSIRMIKTHPNPQNRSVGNTITFTLTISNTSAADSGGANTIRVIDVVPTNLTIGAITPSTPFTCAVAGQNITCNNTLGPLNAGLSSTITVVVVVAAGATNPIINRAKVGTNGADPLNNTFPTAAAVALCTGTNTPAIGCAVDPVPLNADLQIFKDQRLGASGAFQTSTLAVPLNGAFQYRLLIVNATGSALVSTATFSDLVPIQVTVSGSSTVTLGGGAAGCSVAFAGNQITGTVTSLPAGSTCTVVIQATGTMSNLGATNTALVTAPSGISDTVPGNNTSTVLTAIGGAANLTISKTNGVGTVLAGGSTTYTITAANSGPSAANGATLYDPVSTGLVCTAAPVCTPAGGASCPVGLTIAQLQNSTPPVGVAITLFLQGAVLLFLWFAT